MKHNRLIHEKSPYLLQHAHNPVDWYPWGDEAFEQARLADKPVFVSIGYATCHWCHVMAHESFENEEAARNLNDSFVCIKVDREERPDIDAVYMAACNLITGKGGWPLSVFLTPDRKPFFAATYIPLTSRFGQPGMIDLCRQLSGMWHGQRQRIVDAAAQMTGYLKTTFTFSSSTQLDDSPSRTAFGWLKQRFDVNYGGFESAPKFPTPHRLLFLLQWAQSAGDPAAVPMVEKTLLAMRNGGIWDHVGFGFHRYSTDEKWILPHFEKMLYDQALLSMAYLNAFASTQHPEFAQTARDIFTYLKQDMMSPEGVFYSAEDADSEGEEGRFYVWHRDEFKRAAGPEADLWEKIFDIRADGNFHDEATGQAAGSNILYLRRPLHQWADSLKTEESRLQKDWNNIRDRLSDIRKTRIRPLLDDKILTDWNGLMIAALAQGSQILKNPEYLKMAEAAADWILREMRDSSGRLLHRHRLGESGILALADDYAFLIHGLLDLYQADANPGYLPEAIRLQANMESEFADETEGGFFTSALRDSDLPVRPKEIYDGALPSANSVTLYNLVTLATITHDPIWKKKAERLAMAFMGTVREQPQAYTFFLIGLNRLLSLSD
jgi:uncharacterized protein YyaL (SSP411 family)